jgi:hypothetical protein
MTESTDIRHGTLIYSPKLELGLFIWKDGLREKCEALSVLRSRSEPMLNKLDSPAVVFKSLREAADREIWQLDLEVADKGYEIKNPRFLDTLRWTPITAPTRVRDYWRDKRQAELVEASERALQYQENHQRPNAFGSNRRRE